MTGRRVERQAAQLEAVQAAHREIDLRDRRLLKPERRIRFQAHDPKPAAVEDEKRATCRIDRHALRRPQGEPSQVGADQRARQRQAIRPRRNLDQIVTAGLEHQHAIGRTIEHDVDRLPQVRRELDRINEIADQVDQAELGAGPRPDIIGLAAGRCGLTDRCASNHQNLDEADQASRNAKARVFWASYSRKHETHWTSRSLSAPGQLYANLV